ncbi:hypothetical protein ASD62_05750 [Phycicoccus sp. Root563]|uniref:hypothetical protein n=1 Tax=Phycicoccus sp. Root563 TaxID=1736562 RepID=UPI000702AFAB|nr:hypothetical protein [Phycicoccus sp. Root563]KQZ88880.1 hypothetical protein ASD62_05750 [Phycicoccus sp. Root563]
MTETWDAKVQRHRELVRKRGSALSHECVPPVGHAADWYWDAINYVPRSGRLVARQLARLCGDDTELVLPIRSLTDAVATRDKAGRTRAFVERGVEVLADAGWLHVHKIGHGRGARTTYRLHPGDRHDVLEVSREAA